MQIRRNTGRVREKPVPWIDVCCSLNMKMFERWIYPVMSHCLSNPTVTFLSLSARFDFLKPVDLYALLEVSARKKWRCGWLRTVGRRLFLGNAVSERCLGSQKVEMVPGCVERSAITYKGVHKLTGCLVPGAWLSLFSLPLLRF